MKSLLLCLTLLISAAHAGTVQTLLTTTNNNDNLIAYLSVHLDENNDIIKFEEKALKGSKVIKHRYFTVEQVVEGIVLHEERGRAVYKLKSTNLSSHQGGIWEMSYLYNGITGTWLSKDVDLRRDGDSWSVYFEGKKVSKVFIKVNRKPIIGVIGVRETLFN